MSGPVKIIIALFLMTVIWVGVLLKLGLWRMTVTPAPGSLALTFDGWARYPVSRHLFLAQINPNDFEQGKVYVPGTYPFVFINFLLLAPFHFLLGLPYNIAQNFLPYFYGLCLVLILIMSTRNELLAIANERRLLLWLLVFVALGIVITDPLPWTSSFNASRVNPHILTVGLFCYLSTWVFYDKIPKAPFLVVGIIMAVWSPAAVPAWILAGLFFHPTLKLERKWILQVGGVLTLAAVNATLPRFVSRLAGVESSGSGFLFRSGFDGSTADMTSIPTAVFSPADPRHWPTVLYFVLTAVLALGFHFLAKDRKNYRPLQQAAFLLIPYSTFAILLPQLTSIHSYETDLFIFVPATFLMSFWSLQKPFREKLSGRAYVGWLLFAGFILMSNLLTVAQMLRLSSSAGWI